MNNQIWSRQRRLAYLVWYGVLCRIVNNVWQIIVKVPFIKIVGSAITIVSSYLSVGTCATIGQFRRPYFSVRPAKFKTLFELKSSPARDITNISPPSFSRSLLQVMDFFPARFMARALRAWAINPRGKNPVRNSHYGPRTRLVMGIFFWLNLIAWNSILTTVKKLYWMYHLHV